MTARLVLASFGALWTLGCADMLGLGGLTFDQAAAGGAGGSGGGTVGSGGSPGGSGGTFGGSGGTAGVGGLTLGSGGEPPITSSGGTPSLGDEYPLTWPAGAIIAAEWPGFDPNQTPPNSTFWVYQPGSGALATHRLVLSEPDEIGSSPGPEGWDLVYTPAIDGYPWLFGYEAASGLVDYGPAPVPGEAFAPDTQAGSAGWTHVLLAGDASLPLLVAADSETGMVRIGPADPTIEDPVVSALTLQYDFTELLPYRIDETDGIVALDSATGQATFLPFTDGTLGEPTPLELGALPGWTLAATYRGGSGASFVLYNADTGRVETCWPSVGGYGRDDTLWRLDLTALVPLVGEGEPWAMTYDAETGVADLRALEPLHPSIVVK